MTRPTRSGAAYRFSRRRPVLTLIAGLPLIGACAISDPLEPPTCNEPPEGTWAPLGLAGHDITAAAETADGLFATTDGDGVYLRDPETFCWLRIAFDTENATSLALLSGPPEKVLVGFGPSAADGTPAPDASTDASIWTSEGGVEAWIDSADGLETPGTSTFRWIDALAPDPVNPNRVYAGSEYSIYRSNDRGVRWAAVYTGPRSPDASIRGIVASSAGDGRIWAVGVDSLGRGYVRRSTSDGATWDIFEPAGAPRLYGAVQDPSDADVILAAAATGVLRSDDGGESWTDVLVTTGPATAIATLGSTHFAAVADAAGTALVEFYASTNGGETWSSVDVRSGIDVVRSMRPDGAGRLLVATATGLWRFTP